MRLTGGDKAPRFTVEDLNGAVLDLEEYQGRYVLLNLHRFSRCPFCNLRVRELALATPRLRAIGVHPVAVVHSSAKSVRRHMVDDGLPFPIVPDPSMAVYRLYGVERSWWGLLRGMLRMGTIVKAVARGHVPLPNDWRMNGMPADILIGPDGRIVEAHYGRDMGDHLPLERVEALVSASPAASG